MFENLFARRGLSLDRLRTFIEVQEAGGIARAAVDDPVRQSQYSRQIKELEEYFGVELVRRKGKGLELTRLGRELARTVREQFSGLSDFQQQCETAPVRFSMGAGDSLLNWLIIPQLGELQGERADLGFRLENLRSRDIVQELYDMRLDFGVIRKGVESRNLKKVSLGSFDYAFYVPKVFVKGRKKIRVEEVLEEIPLATQGSDGSFRQELEANVLKAGIRLNIRLNCESFPQAHIALMTGSYAAVLPTIVEKWIDSKVVSRVDAPFLKAQRRSIDLAWNRRLARVRPYVDELTNTLVKKMRLPKQ